MIGRIMRWEMKSIFSSKKFLFAFLFQFTLIITFIPLLDTYMESLEKNEFTSLTPGTQNFVPAASSGSELSPYLVQEKTFRLYMVGMQEGGRLLKKRIVAAHLTTKDITLDSQNPKSEVAKFYITRILQKISTMEIPLVTVDSETRVRNPSEAVTQEARIEIKKTTELIRKNNINVTTILILLLPLFVSSGLLLDLLMGEKEKRTAEILLALPTRPQGILASKILSTFSIVFVQVVSYLVLLFFMGRVSSFFILFPLFLTSMLLISLTTFVAVYSRNYKEAGFVITILYVLLFSFMFGATMMYALAQRFAYLSPLTLLVMIESGRISAHEILWASAPTLIASSFFFYLSSVMYVKDDFQFGPRPSNATLLARLFSAIGKSPSLSSLVGGFVAVPLSLLFELSLSIIFLYIFGVEKTVLFISILTFAFIEEGFKSLGIVSARMSGGKTLPLYGALTGVSFSLPENLLFVFAIHSLFPAYLWRIILLRVSGTVLHIVCSTLVGWGMGKGKYYHTLAAASLIHAAFNFILVMT